MHEILTHSKTDIAQHRNAMAEFSSALRALVADAPEMRPFLCMGNPLACNVAVVGINPAATTPFWPFWTEDKGLDRASWINEYKALHNGNLSRSRAALERFVPQVTNRVIELNAHAKQSKRLSNLKGEHRTTAVLEFMLGVVQPAAILCAGTSALKAVRSLSLPWAPTIIEARHFIYWGREYERELAEQVNSLL
ncbi:MAG: hypothetical protein Q7T10_16220 [Rhodoferax sp.]|uniref:hypothetical protein n=1 Tax=Rhodoferax sp. TaxID=50421 RepID=UPI00271D65FD|nr:hypothetical protein [Rhodoferax sp.]MDO8450345.1 hypothetical protein [Rhodoferax sp.]